MLKTHTANIRNWSVVYITKQEIIISSAESKLGCPYVYGTWGQLCTVALRKRYASYNPKQRDITYKRCQRLRPSRPVSTCDGCPYQGKLAYDCRGFTHWCLKQADISITGGSVARQWTDKNWAQKGEISEMPDLVCCVFIRESSGKWSHTGLHVGHGRIIHCSGEVKPDTVTGDRNWTHYAIPNGLYSDDEIQKAGVIKMLKKGSQGSAVVALQEMLIQLGYPCGKADGIYGTQTASAVKKFQQDKHLVVDGIAGEATLAAIAAAAARVDADGQDGPQDGPQPPQEATQTQTPENMRVITLSNDQYKVLLDAYTVLQNILGV